MSILMKLYLIKLKGMIRNLFSKPASALFTIAILLFYGALLIFALTNPDVALTMAHLQDISEVILINIGFSALMVTTMMLQKKMALFTEDDAFYLFTGPFKRSAIMQYLMAGVVLSALMFGAVNLLMIVLMGNGLAFDGMFLFLCFLTQFLLYFFFLITQYYIYLRSLESPRMKRFKFAIPIGFAVLIVALFAVELVQHDFAVSESFSAFVAGDLFHFVPLFGWVKLTLISYVAQDMLMCLLGVGLLLGACALIFALMSSYRADFVEDVMRDAQEFSARYKAVREGKADAMQDRKVKTANVAFKAGAGAIFSKNMLLMKKTNDFIRMSDVISIGIYLAVSLMMGLGFAFFCYMLIFWLFSMMQNSDFMRDMQNYQIYLIPDKPFKKLICTLLPTLLKCLIVLFVSIAVGAIIMQPKLSEAMQYVVMLCGYTLLFMSTTVLSLRVLKSRNNAFMENMLRMLLMFVSAIPSTAILIYFMSKGELTMTLMNLMMVYNLLINFVISGLLLFACRNMMSGREIISE